MGKPVYFWKHTEKSYKVNRWRSIFCQWYPMDFKGSTNIPYNLEEIVLRDDLDRYIIGKTFSSREKWMMVSKLLLFSKEHGAIRNYNIDLLEQIILPCDNPAKLRSLGRKVKGFNEDVWDTWKYKIVVNGNYLQFTQNDSIKKILLDTKNKEIVEASPFDRVWGIGYSEEKAETVDRSKWGQNLLGKALMEVRSVI